MNKGLNYLITLRTAVLNVHDPGAPMLRKRKRVSVQPPTQPADVPAQAVLDAGYQGLRFFGYFHHIECWVYIALDENTFYIKMSRIMSNFRLIACLYLYI